MSPCDRGFTEISHMLKENLPRQSRHASASLWGSRRQPRWAPTALPPSFCHNNWRGVEVQNTQKVRCWTFTALVSCSSIPRGLLGKSQTASFFFFFGFLFLEAKVQYLAYYFKAEGVKASVWFVVQSHNNAYSRPRRRTEACTDGSRRDIFIRALIDCSSLPLFIQECKGTCFLLSGLQSNAVRLQFEVQLRPVEVCKIAVITKNEHRLANSPGSQPKSETVAEEELIFLCSWTKCHFLFELVSNASHWGACLWILLM